MLRSKNFELMKDSDIHKDYAQKFSDFFNTSTHVRATHVFTVTKDNLHVEKDGMRVYVD